MEVYIMKTKRCRVKGILFWSLLLVLCLMSVTAVSARRSEIAFLEDSGLTVKDEAYIIGIPERSRAAVVTERLADPQIPG